jgi:DNA-binding transcriptional MerR regulator
MSEKYISTTRAKEILGVHTLTLHNWEKAGKIETIRTGGGHRLYNVEKYLKDNANNFKQITTLKSDLVPIKQEELSDDESKHLYEPKIKVKKLQPVIIQKNENETKQIVKKTMTQKENICYIKYYVEIPNTNDNFFLKKERKNMQEKYPGYIIIDDSEFSQASIKNGFKKIMDLAISGQVENLLIINSLNLTHEECEILKYLVETYSQGSVTIDTSQKNKSNNKNNNNQKKIVDSMSSTLDLCVSQLATLKKTLIFKS